MPLAPGGSVKLTEVRVLKVSLLPLICRKIRAFIGYPMAALTERVRANISMTYPVVI
jgi:hypothetical protein